MPSSAVEAVSTSMRDRVDWEYLVGIARRNAVLPLFGWNLLRHFPDQLPEDVRSVLEQELRHTVQNNMFLTGRLLEIIRFFNENGIEVLPFKGPMLSAQAYGNPALRKYGDLDVLVKPRQFKQAVRLLEDNSYTPLTSVSWLENKNWYISRKKDIYFRDRDGTVNLELHWKLSGSHFGLPKEMNGLWDRLEALDLGGTAVPNLAFNDLLIYLCLHGSRHSWERLSWICDINELIRSQADIDWDFFFSEARRFGCENVVALGLRLVDAFFGLDPRVPASNKIKNDIAYDKMVTEIRSRLFSVDAKVVDINERYLYQLKLKERPFDKWKLHFHYLSWYARLVFTPNEIDKSVLHFPRVLYPLYYLTRPFRLVYSYVSGKSG